MTLALTIALAWAVGLVVVVALCRISAIGDRGMRAQLRWRKPDERPLVRS